MSRGKHGVSSAARQAIAVREADLGTYQHRVARLTAENRELREKLATQASGYQAAERRLRAERDEGIAPQLRALELALAAAKQEHLDLRRRLAAGLGRFMADKELLTKRQWGELASILQLPMGAFFAGVTSTRSARRASGARVKHLVNLEDSGVLSDEGRAGTKGPR